jgi:neutral ceramidase
MTQFTAGAARHDITIFDRDAEMMGWAQPSNKARGVATPLHARAFVIRDEASGRKMVFVNVELCFVSDSIRRSVLARIADIDGVSPERVMMMATHTHSGPGGYSYDLVYTMTTPGFRPRILEAIVSGVVTAIREADAARVPARLRLHRRPVPLSEPIVFNRSPRAYSANPDVQPVDWKNRQRATNRQMTVLLLEALDGRWIGELNWFAVHCTSVHADYQWICADNKGYAASASEHAAAERSDGTFVAAFNQGAAGDVSPNFRWDAHRGRRVGMHDDDFASARFVGEVQAEHALGMMRSDAGTELDGAFEGALMRFDLSDFEVAPRYAGGRQGRRTGHARVGMGFLEGTEEGPGPLLPLRRLNAVLHRGAGLFKRAARAAGRSHEGPDDSHGGMYVFLELGRGGAGSAFQMFNMGEPQAPDWLDPTVAEARRLNRLGALGDRPWSQYILPVQLIRLGELVIVALPNEPTTMAGLRIERQVLAALHQQGVREVVVTGYSNGYAGYLTTWEEYQVQLYEGSSTLHGQWSLAAFQTATDEVVARLCTPESERSAWTGPEYEIPSEHELNARINYVHHKSITFR